jgi:hypothetical protein
MSTFPTQVVETSQETTYAEFASAPGSATFSQRIPVQATFSPQQSKADDGSLQIRANERRPGYRMPRRGSLELTFPLAGANQSIAGALTSQWHYALLKDALGGGNAAGVAGTASGVPTVTSVPFTGATIAAGLPFRIGAKGDGRGDGQWTVPSNAASPAALLVAAAGAPSVGDAISPGLCVYPAETGTATRRFLIGNAATGAQWIAFGCQAEKFALSTDAGGMPQCTIGYRVGYWVRQTFAVPVNATLEACETAPNAGGSVFFNAFGTATRATRTPTKMSVSFDLGLSEIPGYAGSVADLAIQGMERLYARCVVKMQMAWASTDDSTWDLDGGDASNFHLLWTANATAKRSIGLYIARCFMAGQKPTRIERDGVLEYELELWARESTDTTNELTRSAWRLALG